ncbi:hypothetical protein B0H13DRAFT_1863945 [Mycena leptocephala]|nr:hypothetical protein B0H13DRAFT_1863945 [Mycena leptocephala]
MLAPDSRQNNLASCLARCQATIMGNNLPNCQLAIDIGAGFGWLWTQFGRREDIGHGADIEWVEKAGRKMAAEIRVSDDDGAAGADDEDEDPPSVPIPPRN